MSKFNVGDRIFYDDFWGYEPTEYGVVLGIDEEGCVLVKLDSGQIISRPHRDLEIAS